MNILFSFSLFYLSFVPLWISVIFIDVKSIISTNSSKNTEIISIIVILVFAVICCVNLFCKILQNSPEGSMAGRILKVNEEKTITAEFLLAYILPLFTFDFTRWDGVILFLIFFITLGLLCVRHNYFSVNIVFELLGFRFYNCTLENNDGIEVTMILISRTRLNGKVGEYVNYKSMNDEYKLKIDIN